MNKRKQSKWYSTIKLQLLLEDHGTGKTTIIKTMLKLMDMEKLDYALCAPTRKSSQENNRNYR